MTYNFDRSKEIENRIVTNLEAQLLNSINDRYQRSEFIDHLCCNFLTVTPPEKEKITLELITIKSGFGSSAKSSKWGNVSYNIGGLIEAIANSSFIAVSSSQVPWLIPFGILLVVRSISKVKELEITEIDAAVIYAMWVFRDREKQTILKSDVYPLINKLNKKYELSFISNIQINRALEKLVKLKCIKEKSVDSWYLIEKIRVSYK